MGEEFDVLSSVSAHTPSYPSGHTIQALLLAKKLSDVYPHRMKDFFRLANDISWSRIEAGYHFPSDIHYGEVVYKNMTGDNVRIINLLSHLNLLKTHNIISSVDEEKDVKSKLEDILIPESDVKMSIDGSFRRWKKDVPSSKDEFEESYLFRPFLLSEMRLNYPKMEKSFLLLRGSPLLHQ